MLPTMRNKLLSMLVSVISLGRAFGSGIFSFEKALRSTSDSGNEISFDSFYFRLSLGRRPKRVLEDAVCLHETSRSF